MIFRVIDIESTGDLTPEHEAGIIEYGFYDVEWQPNSPALLTKRGRSFVNPRIPCDLEARAVHHITDAEIESGISIHAALDVLRAGPVDYYVAHNAAFEQKFLPDMPAPWLCTYKIALRKWPDFAKHSNQFLRYALGLSIDPAAASPPHRALPDAYVTAHILERILSFNPPLDVLVKISSEPPQPDKIGFGKHKGTRWRDLPEDYLDWIAVKSDMDEDTKWLANKWLAAKQGAPS